MDCLDTAHAVGILARYSANPQLHHSHAAYRVVDYLKGTQMYTLKYYKDEDAKPIEVFSDADFAADTA